jgi:hypothetical protein
MERARATVAAMPFGHAVLFEINRKEMNVKPKKPFDGRMEDDTWARYKDVFQQLICFIRRTDDRDENRPTYEFTNRQGELYDEFVKAAQGESQMAGEPSDAVQEQLDAIREQSDPAQEQTNPAVQEAYKARADRLCLDFMVALFDHPLNTRITKTHHQRIGRYGVAGGWRMG